MIYTEKTKKAMKICHKAHAGQTDRSGVSYVFHPFHVAEQMKDENETIVALLHDVVEDSRYTLKDIANMGFPEEVVEALRLLTHDDGTPYQEYVEKLAKNPLAREIKIADLRHNMDRSRLKQPITERDEERLAKYEKAMAYLETCSQRKDVNTSPDCVEHKKSGSQSSNDAEEETGIAPDVRGKKKLVIQFDYLNGPLWKDIVDINTGDRTTGIPCVDEDRAIQVLDDAAEKMYESLYTFDTSGEGCQFDNEKFEQVKDGLLDIVETIIARLNAINDGTYIVVDKATELLQQESSERSRQP